MFARLVYFLNVFCFVQTGLSFIVCLIFYRLFGANLRSSYNLFAQFYTICIDRNLHESLRFITGVRCINLVLAARERSLLWYRRVPALQVYAEVPVFQLDRRQFVFHQGQQRELSDRCRRVSFLKFLTSHKISLSLLIANFTESGVFL